MLANPGTTGKWIDVVLDETSNFNTAIKNFSVFDDGNGYCKTVNFCFRGSNLGIAYIDSITVEIKAPDIAPPVIEYSGETEITTTAGQPFSVKAEAVDEYNNEKISPEYIFSDGAVDENGLLLEGEHSCTLRFTDDAGNFSELKFSIKVEPKDTVAPTFSWAPDKIYANAGMRPVLSIAVDDNRDNEIEPVLVWSKGTFDNKGRFIVGEHTLTISAVDDTGNKIEKIIPVSVAAGLPKIIQS